MNNLIYHFTDKSRDVSYASVGGKGYSLMRMAQAGLSIPSGFVLAVDFFDSWIFKLKHTIEWRAFLNAEESQLSEKMLALKECSMRLTLDPMQETALNDAISHYPELTLFAVRSSSPEEDLEGASFAGGYETLLGVDHNNMQASIRTVFASCLAPRVLIYKKEHGFAIDDIHMAVVVMAQVASEVSGDGFSVNPINNDYDEAILNANWGLGESVVAGLATPDQYIIDKVNHKVLDSICGRKETSIWLKPDGGTEERADERRDKLSLAPEQVLEISEQLCLIEKIYGQPMDIEWTYAQGCLYLLQARPITTHIELPPSMVTAPLDKRKLYLDVTAAVQGLEKPISPLGIDILKSFFTKIALKVFGHTRILDLETGVIGFVSGKIFVNLSNLMTRVQVKTLAQKLAHMDYITGKVLEELDASQYLTLTKPEGLKFLLPLIAWRNRALLYKIHFANIEKIADDYQMAVVDYYQFLAREEHANRSLPEKIDNIATKLAEFVIHHLIAPVVIGQKSIAALNELFAKSAKEDEDIEFHLQRISRSLPHNITIEMGLMLFRIASALDKTKYKSIQEIADDFQEEKIPNDALETWDDFIQLYGFRGQGELDVAAPRYRDNYNLVLNQIFAMMGAVDAKTNPVKVYQQSQKARQQAYVALKKVAKKNGRSRQFEKNYRAMVTLGGYRENHKYFIVKAIGVIRALALKEGTRLFEHSKLEKREDIFNLDIENISAINDGSMTDVETMIQENLTAYNVFAKVIHPPTLLDSRGRILRAKPTSLSANEYAGQAISPGVARAKVKVLHCADEKPLLPGEILVARVTDPAWTPLFVNAAAIILEVGGVLQHGALVAREYGKPCVAGVEGATVIFNDGDLVEVDGALGVIRKIDDKQS